MRAQRHCDEQLRPDRTSRVARVFRLLRGDPRVRIGQCAANPFQTRQHLACAAKDPHRLAAPLDGGECARSERRQIRLDRACLRAGALARGETGEERVARCGERQASGGRRCALKQLAPLWIGKVLHTFVGTHVRFPLIVGRANHSASGESPISAPKTRKTGISSEYAQFSSAMFIHSLKTV